MDRIKPNIKLAFKKWRYRRTETVYVVECSPALRELLLSKERIYVGWHVATVEDFIKVVCCTKCQMYGHAVKQCKAAIDTCGRCGNYGHTRSVAVILT
ncbi:unnamed protein product [Plutella xylostella]|uniref:(diamondback moth) hypothetical protein n=1 Tax=Plutella xylostella TaxID=51655 RepID=A0A8S4CUP4_PLUXY|nr:unnamed protein product [Plutella xylostella]